MSRVAWVTGASSGLGAAVALKLADDGWTVIVSARRAEALQTVADRRPGKIHALPLDVTDRVAVADAVGRIESGHGPLDLALLNAGTHVPMRAVDFSADTVRRLMEVNVMGTANGLEAVLPRFLERRGGIIGIVASVAGYRGLPTASAYAASKAALIAMAEALKPELTAAGVGLKLINPGFVRTPLTDRNDFPMPFLMEVDAAAEALVRGLETGGFEIVFPRRMKWAMKILRALPYCPYFKITRRML